MPRLPKKGATTKQTTALRESQQLLRQFDLAFALMSVIPLLICCYLIVAKFFSLEIFVGLNGFYFLLATLIALLGLLFGRQMARAVMWQLIEARAEAEWLVTQLSGTDQLLDMELSEKTKVRKALETAKQNILGREKLIAELQRELAALKGKSGQSSP